MVLKRVVFDYETRSVCDLKKTGAFVYSLHPTTQPTCLAFKLRIESKVHFLNFEEINTPWKKQPKEFRAFWKRLIDEGYEFTAHNAFFETVIYKNIQVKRYGWPDIPFRQFRCTAAKAAACALPRSLESAGTALNLKIQKAKWGNVPMFKTCKPTAKWNAWQKAYQDHKAGKKLGAKRKALLALPEPPLFLTPEADPKTWEELYKYCRIDVRAEEELDLTLPDLIPEEQEVWFLNQKLNWRGLRVDIPLIRKITTILESESTKKLKELDALTIGLVTKPGARQSILDFLETEGVKLPDMKAKTVEDALKGGKLSPDMKRLLEIRQALSKASTKKYRSFLDRAGEDERVRDVLLYHGASTGRDSGTGIQPQNFPRGLLEVDKDDPYEAVNYAIKCCSDQLKILYGEDGLAILFSAILRNMIIPTQGYELFVADFSKIEVAVCWWLADNFKGIGILKAGKDPYIYQAAANTGKRYEEIPEKGNERQLGKAQVLLCQFGGGPDKFRTTAFDQHRVVLSEKESKKAVYSYRKTNPEVPKLWNAYEEAAIKAIEQKKTVKAGKCEFSYKDKFLWVKLPSGRSLAYREPRIVWQSREFEVIEAHPTKDEVVITKKRGELKKTIEILGVAKNKKDMQRETIWGGVLTNNITQGCARDLMMKAFIALEKKGYQALLTIHDEALNERKKGQGSLKEYEAVMCERPWWGDKNLVIEAEGWVNLRYRK